MPSDILIDETPDIYSDIKNSLIVYPTEVFLVRKKNGVYVSVYLRNKTPNPLVSARVLSLVYREKVDYAELFTKAGQTALSTEPVAPFFDETPMLLPFPLNEKHHLLIQINDINNDDGVEARSNCGFILLYDDDDVEDSDTTTPIMRDMDNNYIGKSDNIDMQRPNLMVHLRVVSAVYPHDRTDSSCCTTRRTPTNSWPTSPSPRWTSSTVPCSSCKSSATRCSPTRSLRSTPRWQSPPSLGSPSKCSRR